MNVPTRCPHCQADVPEPPSLWLRIGVISGAWVLALLYVFGIALLGPVAIPVLPLFVLAGMAIVTEAYRFADADLACGRCRKLIVIDGELQTAAAAEPSRAPEHAAAHEIAA
ncbi:DUF1129 domain-containing protein [Enhygromyxa salina]|uniref:Uncharacterized protein n=1 Tax=Enhygromyxa salina TaxID=215803 RepID=A0A2S9YRR1_9BACT|nr:DUF1129 domain-containing protein [Enhygromyxa salina]PRQ07785.1 hypothetical protein ENSA7_24570 [Enhygromyxa salina]